MMIKTQKKQFKLSDLLTYVVLVIVGFITLVPLLYALFASFKTNAEIFSHPEMFFPQKWTFDNYKMAFESEVFNVKRMLFNSFYYSAIYVIGTMLVSSMAGYAFARGNFPFKKTIFAVFSALLFINLGSITIYPLFDILAKRRLNSSLFGLLLLKIFGLNVVHMYLVKSYVTTLPIQVEEAAKIDGCSTWRVFFSIVVPLLKPIFATIAILSFQSSWNEYLMPQIFTSSLPEQRTLIVGIVALKNSGEAAAASNLMLAGTVLSLIPVIVVYIVCNKYFISGLSAGAVKG